MKGKIERFDDLMRDLTEEVLQLAYDWIGWGWHQCFEATVLLLMTIVLYEMIPFTVFHILIGAFLLFFGGFMIHTSRMGLKMKFNYTAVDRFAWVAGSVVMSILDLLTQRYVVPIGCVAWVFLLYLTTGPKNPDGPRGGKRKKVQDWLREAGRPVVPQLEGA